MEAAYACFQIGASRRNSVSKSWSASCSRCANRSWLFGSALFLSRCTRKPGVPIARLTSFRLDMCRKSKMTDKNKHYNRTYFVHILENRADIGNIVKKFWEIENVKTQWENLILNTEERQALAKVEHSLNFSDGHYEVGVRWKDDAPELPDNYIVTRRCSCIYRDYQRVYWKRIPS